jgi:cell division protein FtsL
MADWAGSMEARNYGIKRVSDSRYLTELLRLITPVAILAGLIYFHLWIRSQIVHLGYEQQQLEATADALRRAERNLILEEEMLKNPDRIDGIARNELAMTPLRPNQIMASPIQDIGSARTTDLALANTQASSAVSRKSSDTN